MSAIDDLRRDLNDAKSNLENAREYLDATEVELANIETGIDAADKELDEAEDVRRVLEDENAALQCELNRQETL